MSELAQGRIWSLLIAVLVVTGPLAGCFGDDEGDNDPGRGEPAYASFAEALAAPGMDATASDTTTNTVLKVLDPSAGTASTGEHPIVVLLYEGDAAIEDATMAMAVWHIEHRHGTDANEDPHHTDHGIYEGSTNFTMAGDWRVYINVTLADDSMRAFQFEVEVTGDGGMDGIDGDETDGNETDGNQTDGNQTDGNQTDGNNTTTPENFTDTWKGRATSTDGEQGNETYLLGANNTTVTAQFIAKLSIPDTAPNRQLASLTLHLVGPDGQEIKKTGRVGGLTATSQTINETVTQGGLYTLIVKGRAESGFESDYTVDVSVEFS